MNPVLTKHGFKFRFMKWIPSSIIKTLGTPNLGKITLWKNLVTTLVLFVRFAIAFIHLRNQLPPRCTCFPWGKKRAHEIDAPNIRDCNFKDIVKRHPILPCQVFGSLAPISNSNICIDIFEKGWPLEANLENVGIGLVDTSMAAIGRVMAMRDNRVHFFFGYTSLFNVITTSLVQIRVFPIVRPHFRERQYLLIGVQTQNCNYANQIIHHIRIPRDARCCWDKHVFIPKKIRRWVNHTLCPFWSIRNRDRWSATPFLVPFLSQISSANS